MSKLIFIDDILRFKIINIYTSHKQYLCVCSREYCQDELDMNVGDYIFMRVTPKKYKRLGIIKSFSDSKIGNITKIIIGLMTDIGEGNQTNITIKHHKSIELDSMGYSEIEYSSLEEALSCY